LGGDFVLWFAILNVAIGLEAHIPKAQCNSRTRFVELGGFRGKFQITVLKEFCD
jgi:hypothetical protein